jgi:WD40 repeat protein
MLSKTTEVIRQQMHRSDIKFTLTLFSKQVVLTGHAKSVSGVAWSCDGKRLATASSDLTARVWNVDQHKEVFVAVNKSEALSFYMAVFT